MGWVLVECREDNLVLANFRESPSRAQNRACDVTLALAPLNKISNECNRHTSRRLSSQWFLPLNLVAQDHQTRKKAKRKIVPG